MSVTITLDTATWIWLQVSVWVTIALVIGIIASVVYHLISEFRTPLESKSIRDASHKKRPGWFHAHDSGTTEFKYPERIGSEGYLVTKPEGKWKFHYTGFLPRPGSVPDNINVADGKDLAKTRNLAEYINKLNTKKCFLKGARIPVWFSVPSKAILASIFGIAGIQITDELEQKWPEIQKIIGTDVNGVFPIDTSALKTMVVSSSYNESQVNADESDSEHIGEERVKKPGVEKLVVFLGIGLVIAGAVMLGAAAFLG